VPGIAAAALDAVIPSSGRDRDDSRDGNVDDRDFLCTSFAFFLFAAAEFGSSFFASGIIFLIIEDDFDFMPCPSVRYDPPPPIVLVSPPGPPSSRAFSCATRLLLLGNGRFEYNALRHIMTSPISALSL
jgi:hypothetical protein